MTANPIDAELPLPPETAEEVYQYLLRSLRRKQGFGLFFVQCNPVQGKEILVKLNADLPQKRMQELRLERDSTTLYDQVETLWQQQPVDILFVTHLEAALLAYEDTKRLSGWSDADVIYTVSWKGVPPILSHLNQRREQFRDHFNACFVFLVPPFVIKYFIQRAPDFFDWRSGLFTFPLDEGDLRQESSKLLSDNWNEYTALTPEARTEKLLALRDHIDHIDHHHSPAETPESTAKLLCQQGLLFESGQQYTDAVASYDKALAIQPNMHEAWYGRGIALSSLGRYEEAITSYDRAVTTKPNNHEAWSGRSYALGNLGRYEEAITSFNLAVTSPLVEPETWYGRGNGLLRLGRYGEAIASYDQALAVNPDFHKAWINRGAALSSLGRYEEAIASYDRVVASQPDDWGAWNNRGVALSKLGRYKEAIVSFDWAVASQPDEPEVWISRGNTLFKLGHYEDTIASYDQALEINPDHHEAWYNRSLALKRLGRKKDAAKSYSKAVALNPKYGNGSVDRLMRFVRSLFKTSHD
jgi:superkiller protein 3